MSSRLILVRWSALYREPTFYFHKKYQKNIRLKSVESNCNTGFKSIEFDCNTGSKSIESGCNTKLNNNIYNINNNI
jgi:hypothetical protein